MSISNIPGNSQIQRTAPVLAKKPSPKKLPKAESQPTLEPKEQISLSNSTPVLPKKEAPASEPKAQVSSEPTKPAVASFENGPILADTESGGPKVQHNDNIDGFLMKYLSDSQPTIPASERLVTSDTKFPSLEPGTRHVVSRTEKPEGYPDRGDVPDNWGGDYKPTPFTDPKVEAQPVWAEKVDFKEALNERAQKAGLDGSKMSDKQVADLYPSYEGSQIVDGVPRNPRGPTGITGQGLLGNHGENTAADPVVFRKHLNPETGETKLQMIAIQRTDNGKWAIPGGMTDYGEVVSGTLGRELREEALGDHLTDEQKAKFDTGLKDLFEAKGTEVYSGSVDDHRNTDTSWMATKVHVMEINKGDADALGWDMELKGGDDAKEAKWMDVTADNLATLNANHGDFVAKSVQVWQEQTGLAVSKDGRVGKPEQ